MSKIILGTADGKNIGFDLDLLLATRLLIQAGSGGGKSWALRRLMEQAFGKVQIICIDPEGEFSTLREKYDFVLAGKGGEATYQRQAPRPQPTASTNGHNPDISGPMQRILDAIAWMESIGVQQPKQSAVAFLAGYTIGGGAYNNPRGALKTAGLIEYRSGDCLALTDAGRQVARTPEGSLTTDELHQRVLNQLPTPEQKILRNLLAVYPEAIDNDKLARDSGYEPGGGAFNNPRGRLRTLGLVDYPQKGMVRAADLLFL